MKRHLAEHRLFERKLARLGMCLLLLSLSGVVVVMVVIWILARITRVRSLLGEVLTALGTWSAFGAGLGQSKTPAESMGNYLLETARSCRTGRVPGGPPASLPLGPGGAGPRH